MFIFLCYNEICLYFVVTFAPDGHEAPTIRQTCTLDDEDPSRRLYIYDDTSTRSQVEDIRDLIN